MAYFDVTLTNDALFSGTYQSYIYDYSYDIYTQIGTIPISVYNPGGNSLDVFGVIDFGNLTGTMTFDGIGETTFSVKIYSNNEIDLIFPSNFQYTGTYIKR